MIDLKDTDGTSAPLVTTVTPMKRGLKANAAKRITRFTLCYNRFPDEKGTESHEPIAFEPSFLCYNRFPDEKGTERFS